MSSLPHLFGSHDIWIKLWFSRKRVSVSVLWDAQTETIWVSFCIKTTYQCTFPLSVSVPVIRGQNTDCNLDMTENVLKGGGKRVDRVKTMEFSYLRKEKSCQMPPLSNKCTVCQECVFTSKLHRTEAGESYLPTYWPRNGDRGGEKRGWGVFLGGLQTVYINSVWESIIKTSVKNNAEYCILYSTAKNVSVCWSMCVWACPKCDCNCVQVPLMWPSAWGLCYQTSTPSTILSALLSFNSWLSDTVAPCVCLLIQELKIQQDIWQSDTSSYQNTKYPTWSLSKQSTSQSLHALDDLSPDPQTRGMSQPGSDRACWARTDSLAWRQRWHLTPSTQGDLESPGYGWKFLLDHFRRSMGSGQ